MDTGKEDDNEALAGIADANAVWCIGRVQTVKARTRNITHKRVSDWVLLTTCTWSSALEMSAAGSWYTDRLASSGVDYTMDLRVGPLHV